ncbi:MAG: Acetyltransferase [Chlamydiae bacterium]|nr:Acetyltransferase [Chlamydiota bacterium]
MKLETEHLIVRPYDENDFECIAKLLGDPRVMKFSNKGPVEGDEVKAYIQKFFIKPLEEKLGLWPIVTKDSEEIIGFAGLLNQNIDNETLVELGYRLNPLHWGKGLASQACKAICFYAKEELCIHQLISIIDLKNEASLQLSKRLGFKFLKNLDSSLSNIGIFHKIL